MTRTRREFLREIGCGALGAAAALTGARDLMVTNALAAAAAPTDYKALVCVFLFGGNDGNSVVVPLDDYAGYAAVRGPLAIPQDQLLPVNPPSEGRPFGLHPSLGRLHALWQGGKLALVANVGPLVAPLTQETYRNNPALRPYQLFSHSDQQQAWQTSYAAGPLPTGWGGRLADLLAGVNSGFPAVASLGAMTVFSAGAETSPIAVPPAPTPLNRALMLKREGDMKEGSAFRQILALSQSEDSPLLVREGADVTSRAIANALALGVDPAIATAFPASSLGNQLKQAAKLIKLAPQLGLRRQVFFCSIGGFDTHANQGAATGTQAGLLAAVSAAMGAFYDATVELGVAAQVTSFTLSDFGRTYKPAGAGGAAGSDHAWGAHHVVLGDAVNGGNFYGDFPTLAPGGPDDSDAGPNARGRWIPTTAVDQMGATLGTWFGIGAADLPTAFPNIGRFATSNLGFMAA